ncbi:uncharacterized protein LOC115452717, partial [Manduca sexta]|uniref:uncharacterized protein LOC115452717 n=1 Tax=Manduca sexta TaxID=7130 RepID=UPI00188E37BA
RDGNQREKGLASVFSPRMDFDQWKPLTGRGDPLRNDPTYDYEPPVLERVQYWADDSRLEHENYPERKSEVLVLGVSSRKPSVITRQPPLPPLHRPQSVKYEDYTYKLSEHYPKTILVPPPPPLPGYQPSLYVLADEKLPPHSSNIKLSNAPKLVVKNTTTSPEVLTTSYALQEANLIYQSSTTNQNWIHDVSQTKSPLNSAVSSDYAGWGPTTPTHDVINDTQNYIGNDYRDTTKSHLTFHNLIVSDPPVPPKIISSTPLLPTFLPTVLPSTETEESMSVATKEVSWPIEETTIETVTENQDYYEQTSTEKSTTFIYQTTSAPNKNVAARPLGNILNMLGPMMSMPMVNGPERLTDNLYAHASENKHVYQVKPGNNTIQIQTIQNMQPPPLTTFTESGPPHKDYEVSNNLHFKKPSMFTHDPYIHMRYTTLAPNTMSTSTSNSENIKSTPDSPTLPMYLIIQGHSKVKTYSSKPKSNNDNHTISNEIPKPNETNEVKHLHPYKNKSTKKSSTTNINRVSKAQNLKSLVDIGLGSIEIQEADVGIKYDVSDGSNVPVEIYRKGIVDSDENNYSYSNQNLEEKRTKRQIDLEDLLPIDEEALEDYLYKFFEGKQNETSITGLIAQAVTS